MDVNTSKNDIVAVSQLHSLAPTENTNNKSATSTRPRMSFRSFMHMDLRFLGSFMQVNTWNRLKAPLPKWTQEINHKKIDDQSCFNSIILPFVENFQLANQVMEEANLVVRFFWANQVEETEGAFMSVKSRKQSNNKHQSNSTSSLNRAIDVEEVSNTMKNKSGDKHDNYTLTKKETEI